MKFLRKVNEKAKQGKRFPTLDENPCNLFMKSRSKLEHLFSTRSFLVLFLFEEPRD